MLPEQRCHAAAALPALVAQERLPPQIGHHGLVVPPLPLLLGLVAAEGQTLLEPLPAPPQGVQPPSPPPLLPLLKAELHASYAGQQTAAAFRVS